MPQAVQVEYLVSGIMHSGEPLASGQVYFYETDGTTAKTIWNDANKSSTASNPVTLDSNGKGEIFADGTYTVLIKTSAGSTIQTLENQYFFPNSGTVSTSEIDASSFGAATNATISTAVSSASGADRTVYLNPGNWAISDNLTIPSNINLKFLMGAYVTVANTKTLTIQGTVEGPNYNIFRGDGTVTYDDRTNIIPSIWAIGGSHDNLTLDGTITVKDGLSITGTSAIPISIQRNEDGASTTLIKLDRTSASPADNDYYDISFNAENDNNQQHEFARIRMTQLDVSDGTEKGQFLFSLADGADGSVDDVLALNKTGATVTGALTVSGDLTVNGTTTTVNSSTLTVVDPLIHLQTASGGGNLSADTNKDVGIVMEYYDGSAKEAFLGWDDSAGKLTFIPDASLSSEVVSGSVGTIVANLEGNVTGTATNATHVTVTDNESTDEDNLITFVEDATSSTGNVGLEMDGNLTYNPSTGRLTATQLAGTLQTAAQANITSVGTLSSLTVSGDATFDTSTLKVDSTNNRVGVGTASPLTILDISSGDSGGDAGAGSPTLRITNTTDSSDWDSGDVVGTLEFYSADPSGNAPYVTNFIKSVADNDNGTLPAGSLQFGTCPYNQSGGATETMRISSSGRVGINHDTSGYAERLQVKTDQDDGYGIAVRHTHDSAGSLMRFATSIGLCGSITASGTTTSYNTSSDYRLKENEVAISDGITRLKLLKPYRFNWKSEPSRTIDGFFAHEVTPAVPEAISGEKDAPINEIGSGYQQIDYGKIVPLLTASLQEAITKIETLETKVATSVQELKQELDLIKNG